MFGSRPDRAIAAALAGLLLPGPAGGEQERRITDLVERWLKSPHADYRSDAFTHWHEEGEVPVDCAACHSGPGFVDFVGGDGTAPGHVDHPAPIGHVVHFRTDGGIDGIRGLPTLM